MPPSHLNNPLLPDVASTPASAKLWALIACAGAGVRAGTQAPKQYQTIAGKPLVLHTLAAFAQVPRLSGVFVAVSPDDTFFDNQALPITVLPCGGASRAQTVRNSLEAMQADGAPVHVSAHDWVLVHDAARCLITPELINQLIDACQHDAVGGLLACPLADTLKMAEVPTASASEPARVQTTVARSDKWLAQTPQMFRLGDLHQALRKLGDAATDEASAMEATGAQPLLVPSHALNLKVTYPQDFALAETILLARQAAMPHHHPHNQSLPASSAAPATPVLTWRIGEGWDIHALVEGRKLILGGVDVPFHKGLMGHSDADALLHAITDALLGAAALGDIGRHFPDTDPRFKGADSGVLLTHTASLVRDKGYTISNVDATIIAQAPKLAPHIPAMCERIAQLLALAPEQVNVKAKTAERMGAVGEGLAMEARAVVMVCKAVG